jgi:ABC-type nitrate/sulfonate/bicarbonate transport system substrate-binding protein
VTRFVVRAVLLALMFALPAWAADTPVTLAVSSNTLAFGGLRIAEKAGLFQQHGLDPHIVVMDSGNAAISAVLGGSAEFYAAGPGEALAARVRGRDVVMVMNLFRGLSGSVILAKSVVEKLGVSPQAPIEQRLRALDQLSIAEPSATSAYLTPIKSAAEAVGAKIRFVYMTQPAMVAALQVDAVQGIVAGAPFSLTAVANGSGTLWISGPKGELPAADRPISSVCIQTTADYARSHAEMIQALRAVFTDLVRLIKTEPDKAKAFLAKGFPQLDPASLDAAFAESADNWSQPDLSVDDVRREIRIQASLGALPGVAAIDPASMLYNGGK